MTTDTESPVPSEQLNPPFFMTAAQERTVIESFGEDSFQIIEDVLGQAPYLIIKIPAVAQPI